MEARTLFHSGALLIREIGCHAMRGPDTGLERSDRAALAIPLRGCYEVERQGATVVADCNTAVFFDTTVPYRVSHPADGGDCTLTISWNKDEIREPRATHAPLTSEFQFAVRMLRQSLLHDHDALYIEETAWRVLGELGEAVPRYVSEKRRRIVERAKAYLGANFRDRTLLSDVARAAQTSPFELARVFPLVTNSTVHRYLTALRHAAVLDAMAAGCEDLLRIAVDAGFAHHSHLTKSFRGALGVTPSEARRKLNNAG